MKTSRGGSRNLKKLAVLLLLGLLMSGCCVFREAGRLQYAPAVGPQQPMQRMK